MMIFLEQIRAARAMLGLKQHELAKRAGISTGTLNNIERGVQKDSKLSTMHAIQRALEAGGIEFIGQESEGMGIRLKPVHLKKTFPKLLIIDDNHADRKLYKAWLSNVPASYTILEARNAKEGYEMFLAHTPECIVLDFMMYGKNGFQLLIELKKEGTEMPPIIFVTAMGSQAIKKDVLALGVHRYLDKRNLSQDMFLHAVAESLAQENSYLQNYSAL